MILISVLACGGEQPKPVMHTALGGGVVARVGDIDITSDAVTSVAKAQNVDARTATDNLVDDALAAKGAQARGIDQSRGVKRASRAVLAKTVLDRVNASVGGKGPPTDAEVEELTKRYWRQFDLPEQLTAIHAIVMIPKNGTVPPNGPAVADDLHAAVVTATDAADFERKAKTVDGRGLQIKVESIGAFVPDGRMVEGGSLDQTFVNAAFATAAGGTTPVVLTKFGWHVIRVLERFPGKTVPFEERRIALADEVQRKRAHDALEVLVLSLKKQRSVSIEPTAVDSMDQATRAYFGVPQ